MTAAAAVIVCTHDITRLALVAVCVRACVEQLRPDDELVVVCDGPVALVEQVRRVVGPAVTVTRSEGSGLSAARNHGVAATRAQVIAFIDDDACPRPGWLDSLRSWFDTQPDRVVSGSVLPRWVDRHGAPPWFPAELGWTVGCDYAGLPPHGAVVRNPIGANMAVGRSVLQRIGGFDERLGRRHRGLAGCEETAMAISAAAGGTEVLRDVQAVVDHAVGPERQRVTHVLRRCVAEGRSKAHLGAIVGTGSALSAEHRHAVVVLPRQWFISLAQVPREPQAALMRVALSMIALAFAALGYAIGCWDRVRR